jgi:hypothetical protein
MTVTLHDDVIAIVREEAEALGITFEQAANFLMRLGHRISQWCANAKC